MGDRGYILLDRETLDHSVFKREKFTEPQAWIWLLTEANWRPGRRRIGDYVVDLGRGELAASLRHLSEKWLWHRAKVERFLKRIKTEAMIETRSEIGINVITICNYEKFQGPRSVTETPSETPSETPPRHLRDTSETKENTNNTKNNGKENIESPPTLFDSGLANGTEVPSVDLKKSPDRTEGFDIWWKHYPRRVDKGAARRAYAKIVGSKATPEQLLAGAMRYAAERQNEDPKYTKHPTTWLNAEGWGNEPLPALAAGQNRGTTPHFVATRADSAVAGIMSYLDDGGRK